MTYNVTVTSNSAAKRTVMGRVVEAGETIEFTVEDKSEIVEPHTGLVDVDVERVDEASVETEEEGETSNGGDN